VSKGDLLGPRRLRELLDKHGIRPKKELGQNFVIDPNTIRKMLSVAAVTPQDRVLEIGPGVGSLTLALARTAAWVTCVEIDSRLVPVLQEVLTGLSNVEVRVADAVHMDLGGLDATCLVGNLPYGIAATVVVKVLEEAAGVGHLTVMTQREVGERLVAGPGSKSYGQTSVFVSYFARAAVAARVSKRAFYPVPGVDSVVVRLTRRPDVPDVDPSSLFTVVRTAFSQRRKTLRSSLAAVTGSRAAAEAAARRAGADPGARAEELDIEGFVALAKSLR
jgi:16S rRNA (adenine1518-N6/adenine1519-N6)-dimethyltransferase